MFIIKFICPLPMKKEASSSGDEVTDRGRSKFPLFSSDLFFSTLKPQPLKVAGNCTTEMGKFISFRKIHFTMI